MTGRELLIQGLREKCLHQLISKKYKDEGVLFWTFFKYLDDCFLEDGPKANSIEDCYDWSTVMINGVEEVNSINHCVSGSFEVYNEYASDNAILKADRQWAQEQNIEFHPSITINNRTYSGDVTGQELAFAICEAYKEKPDECDLSWKIRTYQQGVFGDFEDFKMPEQRDYIYEESNSKMVSVSDHPNRQKLWAAIGIILVVNFGVLFAVRRHMKK